ncbi:MAG: SufD family Fe-S cluster assembly protein [Candidatus Aenigmarchaeota archaeon]|nr:SufD family Fe-S cluster assembly protein [Candidatus Aenigmarchaeota archaeon]
MSNIISKEEAMQKYGELALPKENEEPWRYTDLRLFNLPKSSGTKVEIKIEGDTQFVKPLNTSDIKNFSKLFVPKDKIDFLHAASWKDGFLIQVPKNKSANIKISTNSDSSSHNIIILEENATLKLFYDYNCFGETTPGTDVQSASKHTGVKACISTDVTEIFSGASSNIQFVTTRKSQHAYNFSTMLCDLQKNANIKWVFAASGGKLTRIKVNSIFNGEGASSESIDMFTAKNGGHIDITTNAEHIAQNTTNNMHSRGVLYDNSSSIYRGLIKIDKQAQKTSSHLHGKNLKMSPDTTANSIPSLMIDANDVQASHGDSTSKVDENQVYYLMSRGLSKDQAEKMIVEGFFDPLLSRVPEEFRNVVEAVVK